MKRSLLALILLTALAAGGLLWAAAAVGGQSDDVVLREERRAGDPADAAGFTVSQSTTLDGYLHWDTALALGPVPAWETDFRYTGVRERYSGQPSSYFYVNVFSGFGTSTSGYFSETELEADFGFAAPLILAAIEATPAGAERTVTLDCGDYLPYLPVQIDAALYSGDDRQWQYHPGDSAKLWPDAADFFCLPADGVRAEVTVATNEEGFAYDITFNLRSDDGVPELMTTECFAGDGGLYLAAAVSRYREADGAYVLDETVFQPGIYYLPWRETEDGFQVDTANIRLCYALSGGYAERIDFLGGGTRMLAQYADGRCVLLDTATWEAVQTFALPTGRIYYWEVWVTDELLLCVTNSFDSEPDGEPVLSARRASLWTLADGRLTEAIDCDVPAAGLDGDPGRAAFAYDGTRLLLAMPLDDGGSYNRPGFTVAVCGPEGLLYGAAFRHSQADDPHPNSSAIELDGPLLAEVS